MYLLLNKKMIKKINLRTTQLESDLKKALSHGKTYVCYKTKNPVDAKRYFFNLCNYAQDFRSYGGNSEFSSDGLEISLPSKIIRIGKGDIVKVNPKYSLEKLFSSKNLEATWKSPVDNNVNKENVENISRNFFKNKGNYSYFIAKGLRQKGMIIDPTECNKSRGAPTIVAKIKSEEEKRSELNCVEFISQHHEIVSTAFCGFILASGEENCFNYSKIDREKRELDRLEIGIGGLFSDNFYVGKDHFKISESIEEGSRDLCGANFFRKRKQNVIAPFKKIGELFDDINPHDSNDCYLPSGLIALYLVNNTELSYKRK